MRAARRSLALLLWLGVLAGLASGQEDDPQVQEHWARWLDDPLDLSRAAASEIALLPWLDHHEAVLVEGLAREGRLRRLEDLRQVPGLDPAVIEALEPFVTLGESGAEGRVWGWHWRQDEFFERGARAGFRRTARMQGRGATAALRWRPDRLLRGWIALEGRGWRLGAGSLRGLPSSSLLIGDATQRSRTAPASARLGRRRSWTGSLSAAAPRRALALVRASSSWHVAAFAEADPRASASGWVESGVETEVSSWGLALVRAQRTEGGLWWHRRRGDFLLRTEAVGDGRAWRSSAALVWSPARWRIGLASTQALVATGAGRDPVSGLALDREHRSWQLSALRRWSRTTLTLLWRRMQRGALPDREDRSRLRLWLRAGLDALPGEPRRVRWELHLRLGRDEEGPVRSRQREVETQVRLELRRRSQSFRQRLVLSRRGKPERESRSLTVQVDGGGRRRWRLAYATAAGRRAHPWAAGLPESGILMRWLGPGESLALVGLGVRHGRWRLGVWGASAWSQGSDPEWRVGWSLIRVGSADEVE